MKGTFAIIAIGLALASHQASAGAVQAAACGTETEQAWEAIERFLTSSNEDDVRDVVGLGSVTPEDLDRLRDETDAEACARLRTWLPSRFDVAEDDATWWATYYRAPNRYLAVLVPREFDSAPHRSATRIAVFAPDGRMLALLD